MTTPNYGPERLDEMSDANRIISVGGTGQVAELAG